MDNLNIKKYGATDNFYGLRAVTVHWGAIFLAAFITPFAYEKSSYTLLFTVMFFGVAAYRFTIVMHECAHSTLFNSKSVNIWVGLFTGWILGTDFKAFKAAHF